MPEHLPATVRERTPSGKRPLQEAKRLTRERMESSDSADEFLQYAVALTELDRREQEHHHQKFLQMTSEELFYRDRELALAKIRMDIERELRRIAYEATIEIEKNPTSVMKLATELAERERLNPQIVAYLRDVIHVANQAIHGQAVTLESAETAVRAGQMLVDYLRNLKGEVRAA